VLSEVFNSQRGGILGHVRHVLGRRARAHDLFALNIMPYISAAIIIQLMTAVSPALEQLKKGGESGRKKAEPVHALPHARLAVFQALGIASASRASGRRPQRGDRSRLLLPQSPR
jgi:preprotein translocase subunit SecY